jgi:GTP pyrophosphokinase
MNSVDDLYAAIGYGGIMLSQVTPKLREFYRSEQKEKSVDNTINEKPIEIKEDRSSKKVSKEGVHVKGIDNVLIRFAKCCNPVPGDDIIGFITRGKGVTVHRADCTNFEKNEDTPNRFIEVEWNKEENQTYSTDIQIVAPDRKGLLGEITILISEAKLTVTGVNAKLTKNDVALINLTIEITDTDQLLKLMNKLKSMPEIIDVRRVSS